ncbi:WD40 repeat domain-containing protein [Streptacidiphilus fuscans]|uniref:WD40 repeat protein n=1 Tax=Streptacidiphilus fuscans TaxID=2789292 RepID=A0A931FIP0_9ACTN|nr:hypothetical protein [Streptacidiphilus fuscans]MBF9071974.1 hypothetical protein [Streptacidiphilus fuscans]
MERIPIPPLPGGRRPAGAALLGWLADPLAPRLCVVTGAPDSGKSHLLAWLTAAASVADAPSERRVHAMVPLRGLTVSSAVWTLARQLDLYARTPQQLLGALAADSRATVLCLADLHRAGGRALPGEPRQVMDELLVPLLALPQVRVVVEADPATAALLQQAPRSDEVPAAVLDLDAPQWTNPERFARWYAGLPGAADRAPAEAVYPSPGLAHLAARLGKAGTDLVSDNDADGASATTAARLVDRWWAEAPDAARPAIAALASVDVPITADGWARLVPDAEARQLAADLLPATPSGAPVLSAAVAEHLRPELPPEASHRLLRVLIGAVPRQPDGGPDLDGVPEEHLTLLLAQTLTLGQAGQLLDDPGFLVRADPHQVTTALKATGAEGPLAEAWAGVGPALAEEDDPGARADILRHRLHGTPFGPAPSGWATGDGRRTVWRLARGAAAWPGPVTALAAGRAPDGTPDGSLLAADASGAVHRLSQADGSPLGRIPLPAPRPLRSLACGASGADRGDGAVAGLVSLDVWGTPAPELPPGVRAEGELTALLGGFGLPEGVVVLGDVTGAVAWHDTRTGDSATVRPHAGPVSSLAVALPPGLPPLVFSGGADGTVRLWSPGTEPLAEPLDARTCPVLAVSVASAAGDAPLTLAVSWADGLVRVLRLGADGPTSDLRIGAPVQDLLLLGLGRLALAAADELSVIAIGR